MRLILVLFVVAISTHALGNGLIQTKIKRLENTGLYENIDTKPIAEGVVSYEPRFGLFTNAVQKRRFISLPEGSTIVAKDLELWQFPNGTKIWKEFSIKRGSKIILLETRYIEKDGGNWKFGTYVWNDRQDKAELWNNEGSSAEISMNLPGQPKQTHAVPSFHQCISCHDQKSSAHGIKSGEPVLGFTSFQLPKEFIEDLYDNGRLSGDVIPWQRHRTFAANENERDVIGYLHANCGHCHNQRRVNMVPRSTENLFRLNYDLETHSNRANMHLIQQIGRNVVDRNGDIPGVDESTRLISPGNPEKSMIYLRMSHRNPPFQMPLLGVSKPDEAFINGPLKRWIDQLTPLQN